MEPDKIKTMLEFYDRPHLECDGATRVFAWLLKKANIPYVIKSGRMEFDKKIVVPHYWIELEESGYIVDFKSRMWLGDDEAVPHGVFRDTDYPRALYVGHESFDFLVSKTIFEMLTGETGDQDDEERL